MRRQVIRHLNKQDEIDLDRWDFFNDYTLNILAYKILVKMENQIIDRSLGAVLLLDRVERLVINKVVNKDTPVFQFVWGSQTQKFYLGGVQMQRLSAEQAAAIRTGMVETPVFILTSDVISGHGVSKMVTLTLPSRDVE